MLLFERVGPLKALGRSFGLVKGRWWATFLIMLVCWLLVGLLGSFVSVVPSVVAELFAPESALANAIATVVGTTLSGVILYPYYSAVLTILYFDQRVRKEGFDLQLLAEGLGVERDPDAPLPAPFEPGPVYTPEQRAVGAVLAAAAGLGAAAARAAVVLAGGLVGARTGTRAAAARTSPSRSRSARTSASDWLPPEAPGGP